MAARKFVGFVRHCSDTLVSTCLFCDYVAQTNEQQPTCCMVALRKLASSNPPAL